MLTHIYMEWVPLLIVLLVMENSRIVNLLQGLSLPLLALLLLSNRTDKLKFSDGDWVTCQPKPVYIIYIYMYVYVCMLYINIINIII